MAENCILDNGTTNDLYLENDTSRSIWSYLMAAIYGNLIVFFLFLSVTILYVFCRIVINNHIKRCSYCTDPTSTEMVCEQSKTKKARFCSTIERWTAWLLVDLFRTPTVKKKMINGKLHLKIGEHHSGQVGERVFGTVLIFACVSVILCTYIEKFLVDLFLRLTPTCMKRGDFDVPAACYVLNISQGLLDFPNTAVISHHINCTTWNDNFESCMEENGLLFCFSFHYDLLKSMTEIVAMFGLQSLTAQVTLTIAGKVWRNNKCFVILIIMITFLVPITIVCKIALWEYFATPGNEARFFATGLQQLPPEIILIFSFILSTVLLISTNDSHKTRDITSMLGTTHGHQSDYVTEKRMEEQRGGETDILLMEESRNTWYDSIDERNFKRTQSDDTTSVDKHGRSTRKACSARERNEGFTRSMHNPTGRGYRKL